MDSIDLKAFRKANNLTQTEIGDFLGIQKGFVSRIENGRDKLPKEKLRKLIGNTRGWNTSMLQVKTGGIAIVGPRAGSASCDTKISSAVKEILTPVQDGLHTSYLQRKVEDQEKLIRELYQKIGMLEAKLELASKGDEV